MPKFSREVQEVIPYLELSESQNLFINKRYLKEVDKLQTKTKFYTFFYILLNLITTIFSIITPTLLTLDKYFPENDLFWITFFITLVITISNGLIHLFSINKKYYHYSSQLKIMQIEGWMFFQRVGKYSDIQSNTIGFKKFTNSFYE